jgi:pilus assembly protein FimV
VSKSGYIETFDERTTEVETHIEDEPLETSVKLDVARAYIEAEDTQSALDILSEIMEEGTDEHRKVAHELLEKISPS